MMQAIQTKYHGPTDTSGARISCTTQAGRKYYPWDYSLDVDDNHTAAAHLHAIIMEWDGTWVGGALPDGSGNCYVMASDRTGTSDGHTVIAVGGHTFRSRS